MYELRKPSEEILEFRRLVVDYLNTAEIAEFKAKKTTEMYLSEGAVENEIAAIKRKNEDSPMPYITAILDFFDQIFVAVLHEDGGEEEVEEGC